MKYIIGAICAIIISMSFTSHKCDHVFVQVEQANIKIEQPALTLGGGSYQEYSWPIGKMEGKELICVKCFHKQKQIVDYGQPAKPSTYWPPVNGINLCDSIKLLNAGNDALFLKGGVLQVDSTGIFRIMTHAY